MTGPRTHYVFKGFVENLTGPKAVRLPGRLNVWSCVPIFWVPLERGHRLLRCVPVQLFRRVPIPAVRCLSRILSVASWSPRFLFAPPRHEQFVQFGFKAENMGENRRAMRQAIVTLTRTAKGNQRGAATRHPGTTISTQPSPAGICKSTRKFFSNQAKDFSASFVSPRECPEISWHNG